MQILVVGVMGVVGTRALLKNDLMRGSERLLIISCFNVEAAQHKYPYFFSGSDKVTDLDLWL